MNSRQRRYARRYWKYSTIIRRDNEQYYLRARQWCRENLGKVGYRWGNIMWYSYFSFKDPKDYTLFLLKWS